MVGSHSAEGGTAPWNHVGICVGKGEVVEFSRSNMNDFSIRRVNLDSFVGGHRYMYLVEYRIWTYPAETIVQRACAALNNPGQYSIKEYSIFYNNSKHFASYASTRKRGQFYVVNLHIG